MIPRRIVLPFAALLIAAAAVAQTPAPFIPPAPVVPAVAATPAPPSPVSSIRNKISARAKVAAKLAAGDTLEKNHDLEIALGAAIEVEAQLLEREKGAKASADFLRAELQRLDGPVALRSRVHKRLSMLTLPGRPAAELVVDDFIAGAKPSLAGLRGKPVVLFLWANWCSDCRAQAGALARAQARHASKELQVVALTRYYDDLAKRPAERARVDSTWRADYPDLGRVTIVMSTESMEHYGGSSTPTFVFVDREGVVRGYTPTRLTDAELDRHLAPILR